MSLITRIFAVALLVSAGLQVAQAQDFKVVDKLSLASTDVAQLQPNVIHFADSQTSDAADPGTGLIRFEDWEAKRPVQKRLLSLYPAYAEPTIDVTLNNITKPYKEKLHVYVAEARFVVAKPPSALALQKYVALSLLEKMDSAIKHKQIGSFGLMPSTDPESAHNVHPNRAWCTDQSAMCIQSRYDLEGKLPIGIRLANKLSDGGKKISEYMEFQSELRIVPQSELDQGAHAQLTGIATPVVGALEQNIFFVNQMMQFGKFLCVFQQHPFDPNKTIATAFVALAVETDVLELKRAYGNFPVLRNLVPAQVLLGKSSFNVGTSISAGLPEYTRNRLKAVAGILQRS